MKNSKLVIVPVIFFVLTSLVPIFFPNNVGAAAPSRLYVSDSPSGGPYNIVVIDPATNTQVAAIPVTDEPGESAASPDGSRVYVMVGIHLAVIDVLSNTIMTMIPGAGGVVGNFNHVTVHPDGSKVYVASTIPYSLQIKVIDTLSNTISGTITSTVLDGCYAPLGLGVSPDGSRLYTACRDVNNANPDRFFIIDATTGNATMTTTFMRDNTNFFAINAVAVSPDGTGVFLARADNSRSHILQFDGITGLMVNSVPLPDLSLPRAAIVSPDGTRLYSPDMRLPLHVVDLTTAPPSLFMTTLTKTNSRGFDIAMTPDGARIYIPLLSQIFVIDTAASTWVTTITGGSLSGAKQITINQSAGGGGGTTTSTTSTTLSTTSSTSTTSTSTSAATSTTTTTDTTPTTAQTTTSTTTSTTVSTTTSTSSTTTTTSTTLVGFSCPANSYKVGSLTVRYTGIATGSVQPVRILATDRNTNHVYLDASGVMVGNEVTISGLNADKSALKSVTLVHIYNGAGTQIEQDEIDTSCAPPLAVGNAYGSLLVTNLSVF